MRGFLVGSLALIVLYTVINRAEAAGQVLTGSQDLVRRLLSAEVAAVPDFAARAAPAAAAAAAAGSSAPRNSTLAPFVERGLAPVTSSPVPQSA